MSDLSLGVRLDANSGQLVGQLSAAEAQARGLEGALEGAGQGAREFDGAVDQAGRGAAEASARTRAYDQALDALATSEREAAAGAKALGTAQQQQGAIAASGTAAVGRQRAAYQQLGFQMQDIFQQASLGINPLVILAQQGGQTASAVAMIGDRADGSRSRLVTFASFLAGPYGAAVMGAVTVVGLLIQKYLEADDAAEQVEFSTSSFGEAQRILGTRLDLTTGKIKDQTDATLALARAQAAAGVIRAQASQAEARRELSSIQKGGFRNLLDRTPINPLVGYVGTAAIAGGRVADPSGGVAAKVLSGEFSADRGVRELQRLQDSGKLTEEQFLRAAKAVTDLATGAANQKVFSDLQKALDGDRNAASGFLNPGPGRKPPRPKIDRSAERLADFGEGAREKITRVLADYDPAPRQLDKALQDLRALDALMAELGKRKPPGFEETIASAQKARAAIQAGLADPIAAIGESFSEMPGDIAKAQAALADLSAIEATLREAKPPNLDALLAQIEQARGGIEDSLVRPFRNILADQREGLDLQRLVAAGRDEEADQLALIHSLMRQVGAESEEQLATELAKRGVTADMIEMMMRNLRIERELGTASARRFDLQRLQMQEVDVFRGNVERFFADIPRRGIKALGDFAGGLETQVSDYFARYLTETIFGGVFAQLDAKLSGQDKVREANAAYVGSVGDVVGALRNLESAANDAATAQGAEIIVNGQRPERDPFDFRLKSPRELFGDVAKELLRGLGLEGLADKVGDKVGLALEGAATGSMASSVLLGNSGNRTTSAIGGALGQVAGEELGKSASGILGSILGPLGGIAGGIFGGLVGGLFSSKDYGTVVLSDGSSKGRVTSHGQGFDRTASGLGSSVQEGLARIAESLDATVGSFDTLIGVYDGKYRVRTTAGGGWNGKGGLNFKGKSANYLHDFGDDQAGAIAYAIADAIADGAIGGVSDAVQKALRSSPDVEQAIQEALKVREVEELISGLGEGWRKEMRDFSDVAKERVRIAKQYGLDLVEVEKINAEQRADIIEGILQDRVGSLKDLLDDLTFGDLAEGSPAERRERLREQIAAAQADAEAGKDGAADRLASLQRDLIDLSREFYGTAGGEYGSDRDQALSSAERIIALEEERVRNSQAEVTDRLDRSIDIAGETNDILAQINAGIGRLGAFKFDGRFLPTGLETARDLAR